jgi:hypothetical protein
LKYQANPVIVDAHRIVSVSHHWDEHGGIHLTLENSETVRADKGMLARFVPVTGDYYVIHADGYAYLNPREVFLRKYSPWSQR